MTHYLENESVSRLIAKIAFATGGDYEVATHPPACIRERAVVKGQSTGAMNLTADGNLLAPECSRARYFKESFATAVDILFFSGRPCDGAIQYWPSVTNELCSGCPNESANRTNRFIQAEAMERIGKQPIKRKS